MRHLRGSVTMTAKSLKPCLSAVFVDYDNIYLSLKRKNDEAARRFAKDAGSWVQEIASGRLITPTSAHFAADHDRRIVMNRCYGNPVPRRNSQDNSTDMSSFPFVRHHFLRSGFEVVDCPPLTAQLKNSSDIRMVMDVRDFLNHETYFDEFVILSGDADFTPLLHRLRAHARRTVIFANDYTVAPYTSISDGEIREADLINLLLEGRLPGESDAGEAILIETNGLRLDAIRKEIIDEVVSGVRAADAPVPLEALADRALRNLGHDKTAGSGWAGAGGFRELLSQHLPDNVRLSDSAPYYVYDTTRHQKTALNAGKVPAEIAAQPQPAAIAAAAQIQAAAPAPSQPAASAPSQMIAAAPAGPAPAATAAEIALRPPLAAEQSYVAAAATGSSHPQSTQEALANRAPALRERADQLQAAKPESRPSPIASASRAAAAALPPSAPAASPTSPETAKPVNAAESATAMQQSIARIHDACQAPPIAPAEYRVLFEVMAAEINENGLAGAQTLTSIAANVQARGIEINRDDVRFVLEVVSEADPWFEQGASANLFAGRFRNFVVARCRGQGLNLTAEELDLIDAWFAGSDQLPVSLPAAAARPGSQQQLSAAPAQPQRQAQQVQQQPVQQNTAVYSEQITDPADVIPGEDFPRIVRSRLRG